MFYRCPGCVQVIKIINGIESWFLFGTYKVQTWEAICAMIQQNLGRRHKLVVIGAECNGQSSCWVPNRLCRDDIVYCYYIGDQLVFNAKHLYWQNELGLQPPPQDAEPDPRALMPPSIYCENVPRLRNSIFSGCSLVHMSELGQDDFLLARNWYLPADGKNEVSTRLKRKGPDADL